MEAIKITLKHPVTQGEQTVSEVVFTRRPKVGDLKGTSSNDEVDRSVKLISRLAGLAPSIVSEIDLQDFTELSGVIEGFLSSGPTVGSGQSGQ
jgi:hypothetical protein